MRIVLAQRAPGVPPERALAWWTDFREGPHDHAFVRGQRRTILAREGGRVSMRDDVRPLGVLVFRERTTAWREGNEVRFEGANTFSRFRGAYAFADDGEGGTTITLDAQVDLKGVLKAGLPIARPVARALLRADLRHHAEELAAEAGPGSAAERA